ncbi:MAG TPA: hypothetical protein VGD64_04340 [Acidisarcina sp.]
MNSPQETLGLHQYHMKRWMQVLYGCVALFFIGIGLAGMFASLHDANSVALSFMMAAFVLVGTYLLVLIFRSRLAIEGTRLELRDVFRERTVKLSDIEGYRTVSSRNGTYQQIYLKDGRGKITLQKYFATDDDYRAWFQQLTDLDQRDRKTLLDEIERSDTLGATPEERLAALAGAKRWNIVLIVLCCASVAGLNLGNFSTRCASALVLALAPAAIFLLMQRAPLLYAFGKSKADPRADLLIAFMVAAFGFLFFSTSKHLVATLPLFTIIIPLFIGVLAAFGGKAWSNSSRWGMLFPVVLFGAMYSYGVAVAADILPDRAQSANYSVPVIGRHISHGRTTTYYLVLAPWGPISSPNDLSVGSRVYGLFGDGGRICLTLHPGAVHVPWYHSSPCTATDIIVPIPSTP